MKKQKHISHISDTKQFDYFCFVGDVPVNDTGVSMESSQFSSEVLVTQVNMIMLSYFLWF